MRDPLDRQSVEEQFTGECAALDEGECEECGHAIRLHGDRYGCQFERGDVWVEGSNCGGLVAAGPCGCKEKMSVALAKKLQGATFQRDTHETYSEWLDRIAQTSAKETVLEWAHRTRFQYVNCEHEEMDWFPSDGVFVCKFCGEAFECPELTQIMEERDGSTSQKAS